VGISVDSSSSPFRVFMVSAHPLALIGLRRLAGPCGAGASCGRFEDVMADPGAARGAAVCVVDGCVPPPSRDALIAALLAEDSRCRIVVLAEAFGDEDGAALLRMGVKGLVRYESAADQLPRALGAVAEGGYWAPRTLISSAVDAMRTPTRDSPRGPRGAQLSRREEEVLSALLANLTNKEIAQQLHISVRTVKFHVSNLLSKFGVARRADLILESLQRPARTG
jgi:DNA-binding NarL/FixJ family response regulator